MSDSFKGTDRIILQPGDTSVPYNFQVTVATSSSLNNGHLPYNSTVHTFTASVHSQHGTTTNTSGIVVGSSVDGNTLVVKLGYSTSVSNGLYHLTMKVTASIKGSTGSVFKKEIDYNRLWLTDK